MINLINDPWIPVRLAGGESVKIRPTDLAGSEGGLPVDLDSARPDYDGALIQILIGLYQTFLAPPNEDEWWAWFETPPGAAVLSDKLAPWADAFNLTGERAFMQDVDELPERFRAKIDALHLTAPGNQTLAHNKDLFLKRQDAFQMCATCAPLALAAAQFNATAGGPGFRTSVRGGGPITTILRGENLWQHVWLNVLPRTELVGFEPPNRDVLHHTLPWMGPCRESSKQGVSTTTQDVNQHQVYWSSSKRLQLEDFLELDEAARCDVCGQAAHRLVSQYRELRYGTNYVGPWIHPLTPYTHSDKNDPNPLKGSPDGFAYRHWRGIVASFDAADRKPAQTVQYFRSYREPEFARGYPDLAVGVWAFGYDADNAKIRSWQEGFYPLVTLETDTDRDAFDLVVGLMIESADDAAHALKTAIKQALYGEVEITSTGKRKWRYDDAASTDKALFMQCGMQFWRETEAAFYERIFALPPVMRDEARLDEIKKSWLNTIERTALRIFDETTSFGNFRNADAKASSMARSSFRWAFRHSDKQGTKDGFIARTLSIRKRITPTATGDSDE